MRAILQHNRVSPEGQRLGEQLSRLTDTEVGKLIADGEWENDERCASCAFRYGTVPNGCAQTQMDALKCVMEKQAFSCHVARDGCAPGVHPCMGWFAAMQAVQNKPAVAMPWEFSPEDKK
jgi:hypothetical protein